MPESASEILPETVIGDDVKLLPLAGDVTATVGAVLSIFRVTLALAWAPAPSDALPVMIWFAPSVLTICCAGH